MDNLLLPKDGDTDQKKKRFQNKLVTTGAGFAAWLAMTPGYPDVLAIPDATSLMVLPWQREVAWVATDLQAEGKVLEQSPRRVLQVQLARAAALGLQFRTGVEAEFFLMDPEGEGIADRRDRQSKPCYDQLALMRHYPLIAKLLDGDFQERCRRLAPIQAAWRKSNSSLAVVASGG